MARTPPIGYQTPSQDVQAKLADWKFYRAAYEGRDALVRLGKIGQHERESAENWSLRKSRAVSFGFSKLVVDLLTQFVFSKKPSYELGGLERDALFTEFQKDADLEGSDYQSFLREWTRNSSIQGYSVIVVDKPQVPAETQQEALQAGIYPYVAGYWASDVLELTSARDAVGRPKLTTLRLAEGGNVKIWYPDRWELWDDKSNLLGEGPNVLGEIPAVVLYGNRPLSRGGFGESDLTDIAHLDLSILLDVLDGQQVISYSAFPMLVTPKKGVRGSVGTPATASDQSAGDDVGPTAVLEFDPETPDAKPSWLASECKEPVDAILSWISRKTDSIYQQSGLSGVIRQSAETPSGVALSILFQQLNARLAAKAKQVEETEKNVVRLWQKWQGTSFKVVISRPQDYAVEDQVVQIDQIVKTHSITSNAVAKRLLEMRAVEVALPALTDEQKVEIEAEPDVEPAPIVPDPALEINQNVQG